MSQFIEPTTTTNHTQQLLTAVSQAQGLLANLQGIKNKMDSMQAGPDFTDIEAKYGLKQGDGQVVSGLVSGTITQINVANSAYLQLISRLGI